MTVSPVTTASPSTPNKENPTKSLIGNDFQTFLVMLTAQMKNQDPLNPIEGADYAVQLATFSGVEQQVRTNTLLERMAGGLGTQGLGQFATWVGREARSEAPALVSGAPVTLELAPLSGADAANLIITTADGVEVAREAVEPRTGPLDWSGLTGGGPLAPGAYRFSLESRKDGRILGTSPVESYSRIVEVQSTAEGPRLVLASGAVVSPEKATALRERPGP